MDEKNRVRAGRRSPVRSVLGLVLGVIGLWAGFAILNLVGDIPDPGAGEKALRIVFGIVWFVFWIGALVYNSLNLLAYSRSKKAGSPNT